MYAIKGRKRYWAPASDRFMAGWTEMRDAAIAADIAVFATKEEAKKVRNVLRKKYTCKGHSGRGIRVMDISKDQKLLSLTSAKLKYNVRSTQGQ